MKIIGIDPGSVLTGWGIIDDQSGVLTLIDCGVILTKKNNQNSDFAERIGVIFHELHSIIAYYKPEEAAIEQAFTAKNAATALKLGQARGSSVAACASHNLLVYDYAPTLVKKSIVGNGRADKDQVAFMVSKLLNIKVDQFKSDTTDALGIAICHSSMRKYNKLQELIKK